MPSKGSKYLFFTPIWAWICLLSGCLNPALIPGHFEGTLSNGTAWSGAPLTRDPRELVSIDIESSGTRSGKIQVTNVEKNHLISIELSNVRKRSIVIQIPELDSLPHTLKRRDPSKDIHPIISDCYFQDKKYKITFCIGKQTLFLSVLDHQNHLVFSMKGGRVNRSDDFALEPPQNFTLDQAIDRALTSNLESLIAFEHRVQAVENARTAELNLIPHFQFLSAIALLTLAPPLLLISLADWVPFIFPSHWLRARKATLEAESEKTSYEIMQANLVFQTQGLVYAYMNHKHNLDTVDYVHERVTGLMEFLLNLKKDNLGSKDNPSSNVFDSVKATLINLELNRNRLKSKLAADRIGLSETLGFLNPSGVQDVSWEDIPTIESQVPLSFENIVSEAIRCSLEIRQIDFLSSANKVSKSEAYLGWTQPMSSTPMPLGFNLIPQIQAIRSKGREILNEFEQRRQKIIQNTFKAVSLYNNSISSADPIRQLKILQKKRFDHILEQIESMAQRTNDSYHLEITSNELAQILEEYIASEFQFESHQASFRLARAWIDRLLYIGPYARLLETFDDTRPPQKPNSVQKANKYLF